MLKLKLNSDFNKLVQTVASPYWLSEHLLRPPLWISTVCQTFGFKNSKEYEAQSCPRVTSEHMLVTLRVGPNKANPDFTGVIEKLAHIFYAQLSHGVLEQCLYWQYVHIGHTRLYFH